MSFTELGNYVLKDILDIKSVKFRGHEVWDALQF